jgi:hypothetical protein
MEKITYPGALCFVFLNRYHSGDQVKKTEMGRACSTNGDSRGAYRVLVEKPEGRRPLGIKRRKWEKNTQMHFRGMKWGVHGLDRSSSG